MLVAGFQVVLAGVGLLAGSIATAAPVLEVTGTPTPLALNAADLAMMPRAEAVLTAHGATQRCEGVWLRDVLTRAGVPTGEAVRGEALSQVVAAEARDDYRVVFSLGEIDAALGNGRLLVADRCDGKPLDEADGPVRIVAAGEKRGARSVRGLVRLVMLPAGAMKNPAIR